MDGPRDRPTEWSKSDIERETSYDIPYRQNLKRNDTDEVIYKIETDSQTERTNLWLPRGEVGGRDREFETELYTHVFKMDNQQGPTR